MQHGVNAILTTKGHFVAEKLQEYCEAAGLDPGEVMPCVLDAGADDFCLQHGWAYRGVKTTRLAGSALQQVAIKPCFITGRFLLTWLLAPVVGAVCFLSPAVVVFAACCFGRMVLLAPRTWQSAAQRCKRSASATTQALCVVLLASDDVSLAACTGSHRLLADVSRRLGLLHHSPCMCCSCSKRSGLLL